MTNNAPFKDLLPPYVPVWELCHHPPRPSFRLAILEEFYAFRLVALVKDLERRKVHMSAKDIFPAQGLVLDYLIKLCDPPHKDDVQCNGIYSKEACLALELKQATRRAEQVPTDKVVRLSGLSRDPS